MSLSATGNPYDNATAESCFTTLKPEEVYRKDYPTFAEAEANLGQFIDDVYNSKRLHSSLGYQPPAEFEAAYGQSMAEMTLPTGPVTGGHSTYDRSQQHSWDTCSQWCPSGAPRACDPTPRSRALIESAPAAWLRIHVHDPAEDGSPDVVSLVVSVVVLGYASSSEIDVLDLHSGSIFWQTSR